MGHTMYWGLSFLGFWCKVFSTHQYRSGELGKSFNQPLGEREKLDHREGHDYI